MHQPKGIIKEAQDLAAEAFGADHTFFSVQGTSGAIMAMIMAVCGPGDKIIVPRNVHKSIMSAVVFSGAIPVFIHPEIDKELGISHGITINSVKRALEQYPDAKALLVINPTYFGVSADLKSIVDIAHSYDIPVLVDEAHGVHIHFHDELPLSAMQAGADIAATSVHKLGGSMTQSSILNLKGNRVSYKRVQTILSMLTTTSTSYLLLASLDVARKELATKGRELVDHSIQLANSIRKQINEIEHIKCIGEEILETEAAHDYDPTKLIISVKDLGMSGYDVEKWLRKHYNIEVEMSDLYNILCIITPGDSEKEADILIAALKQLADERHRLAEKVETRFFSLISLSWRFLQEMHFILKQNSFRLINQREELLLNSLWFIHLVFQFSYQEKLSQATIFFILKRTWKPGFLSKDRRTMTSVCFALLKNIERSDRTVNRCA